jgi:AraC family transcriptional regulator
MYFSPTTHGEHVRRFDAGRFILFESTYTPATKLPPHYHDVAAMMFATSGSFTETTGRRTFHCNTYDVMVRPAGEAHTDRYGEQQTSCVIVNVRTNVFPSLGSAARLFEDAMVLPRPRVASVVQRIASELHLHDDLAPLVVEGLLLELIGTVARPARRDAPQWLDVARDYIHAHGDERPSLNSIAAAAGVHPSTLVRVFRARYGCSPGEYLRRTRLETAKSALLSTDRTIADIAVEAGFYDQSHFTNAFRRYTGMTPARFRSR